MLFRKTKKQEAEARKIRFIEGILHSLARDIIIQKVYDDDKIDKMIEYRAREILDWT